MSRQYWIDLFTGKTWDEFKAAGGRTSGFRASKQKTLRRVRPGDWFLCYVTGVSRFIAILEVEGEPFTDESPIWSDDVFPERLPVKWVAELTPTTAVPVAGLLPRLSFYEEERPRVWSVRFRTSPTLISAEDGAVVTEAVFAAQKAPVERPVDSKKWGRTPRVFETGNVLVTIPDDDEDQGAAEPAASQSEHEEIQNLLLRMGADMGFDVWVARNDKGRAAVDALEAAGRLRKELPTQFDEATNRTIEHIDVLWLRANAIEAAFEIEHTTSIYSGLLRMSDLVAMQPNLNIRLYIVAPDEKRERVLKEIARPTFSRLPRPLAEICRFISYSSLRGASERYAQVLAHLKPDFLDEIAETVYPR